MQNKTTIEINGRTYDAKTGTLLSGREAGSHHPAGPTHHTAQNHASHPGHQPAKKQFVDGFVRGASLPAKPTQHHQSAARIRPKPLIKEHGPAPALNSYGDARHHTPAHPQRGASDASSIHHTQHKSETLMRRAVKHPAHSQDNSPKILHKRGAPVKRPDGGVSVSARAKFAEAPRENLASKATGFSLSQSISHFTHKSSEPLPVKLKTIQLKTPPAEGITHHNTEHNTGDAHPAHPHGHAGSHHVSKPASRTHAMLQRGLMAANSHEQHRIAYKKSTRRTLFSVGAGTLAALILTGYIAYANIPNIAMKVAASKAGFSASLPDNPSGYAMKGPIKYSPGRITFNLRSNSNDNTIAITERSSNWDSQSLLKNHVRPSANGDYEAVEASGRTLYMYGASVTWVHGGVWYQIDGNDQLGRDQLVKLATSM